MIRIKLEGNNWNEIVEQLRQMVGDDTVAPIVGQVTHVCKVVPDEGILTENTSPPVEPVDKGDGVTGFRPVIPDREAVAAVNKPPPPTIPAIDALPQTPAPPPPAATDVDARGIPWDGRIHAGNKATTKDGSWKRRRGVSVEEVQRIEAELKGAYDTFGSSPRTVTTEATPAPPPPPAAAPGTEPPPVSFDQLMHVANQHSLGITNLNALTAEVTGGQIGQIALIADKPAYIQAVYDRIVTS